MLRIANETTTLTTGCQWEEWTDEELLLEYRCTGIREAFEELVYRYERELYNFLYHCLGNADVAEDVFQKTFLAVMRKCDKFDANREFRPWLYRIAANKANDYHREKKRYSSVSIDAPYGSDDAYTIADCIEGNEPAPFEDPIERETIGKVHEAVAELPEQMRQAVYMVYFQGLTQREVAETIGVNICTVSKRLKNAVAKLNFMLKSVG